MESSSFWENTSYVATEKTRIVWEENWTRITEAIPVPVDCNEKYNLLYVDMLNQLWNLYNDTTTRFYHTTVHIEEMLNTFKMATTHDTTASSFFSTTDKATKSEVRVLLAIFFHDDIYDAKSSTNEEDSAKLFTQFAIEINLDLDIRETVVEYILATKSHRATNSEDFALTLLLDLDMAVLGKSPGAYLNYAAPIRKEYLFVPEDFYCRKRAEVLTTFLETPHLYATTTIGKHLEGKARKNLRMEIDLLQKNIIPSLEIENT